MKHGHWVAVVACSTAAYGQTFTILDQAPPAMSVPGPRPTAGHLVGVDIAGLRALLAAAPVERLDAPLSEYGLLVTLPAPDGQMVDCFVASSAVMAPELAARFPQMATYIVQTLDRTASGRIEVTQRGLTGMIRGSRGTWMMDAWQAGDDEHVISYWLSDLPGGGDWTCHTQGDVLPPPQEEPVYSPRALQSLRTYRMAMACTGEFGAHHSALQGNPPNTADPLAAIVTIVSRSNVVYEADLAVRFVLVANNELLMYTDGTTDPYPSTCGGSGGTDCSGSILNANVPNLAAVIGNSNFDVGHCVTRIFGGVAYLRSVCTNNKAGGVSGIPRGGDLDPLSALVVIHELGHQFGANHTFSGTRGRCLGNVSVNTAWEAGSGSSPMAYAGGCPVGDAPPTDNITQFADPFFHHGSWGEMQAFLAGSGSNCASITPTANSIPVVTSITTSVANPPGTPFVLSASASDADNDAMAYSWEQFDNGVARPLSGDGAVDDGRGALFRIFPPVAASQRVFPKMSDVLSGIPTPGERLPTVTGVIRKFRVFVRDFAPGAGGAAISELVNLTIAPGTTPFTVTVPAAGSVYEPGPLTVQWTVGGTDLPPVSVAAVSIDLSLDNGLTFSQPLGVAPNGGSATVQLPPLEAGLARIRVSAVGAPFFAVSRPFAVLFPCVSDVNSDGGVDGADIQAFFEFWEDGNAAADFNNDGGIDGGDVEAFFEHWESGC